MTVALRQAVRQVLEALVRASEATGEITLDEVGEAVGTMAIAPAEIEALLDALEARGRRVVAPQGGSGETHLRHVLHAARTLRAELGRTPTPDEIAARSGLSLVDVRRALALSQVMRR